MNNTFDWTRFCAVVRKDFNNIWQHFGLTMLIITLLPLAAWLFWWGINSINYISPIVPEVRWYMIYGCLLLAMIMAPSRMYRTCNLPKEGIYFAMLPASKLEKYLSMILISIFVCPLIVLFGGIVLDLLLTLLPFGPYEHWIWESQIIGDVLYQPIVDDAVLGSFFSPGRLIPMTILSTISTGSIFLFTSTIFKKHKVLLTILWIWLIEFVFQILLIPVFGSLVLNPEWIEKLDNGINPIAFANNWYWIGIVLNIVFGGLFLWWAGYRLKRMKY